MKLPRLLSFLVVMALAQVLIIAIIVVAPGKDNSPNLIPLVALAGAPLGVFAGAVARFSQSTCLRFAFTMFPWLLPFLLLAGLSLLAKGGSRKTRIASLVAWAVGWAGWVLGAVASIGFAVS